VLGDKSITDRVPRKQLEQAFDLARQLRNIDKIFARVFKSEPQRPAKPAATASATSKPKKAKRK
jgi:hypothetical protein